MIAAGPALAKDSLESGSHGHAVADNRMPTTSTGEGPQSLGMNDNPNAATGLPATSNGEGRRRSGVNANPRAGAGTSHTSDEEGSQSDEASSAVSSERERRVSF